MNQIRKLKERSFNLYQPTSPMLNFLIVLNAVRVVSDFSYSQYTWKLLLYRIFSFYNCTHQWFLRPVSSPENKSRAFRLTESRERKGNSHTVIMSLEQLSSLLPHTEQTNRINMAFNKVIYRSMFGHLGCIKEKSHHSCGCMQSTKSCSTEAYR